MKDTISGQGQTKRLAEFIARASISDIPENVRHSAVRYILDSVANQIGGVSTPGSAILLQLFQGMGGKKESSILATGRKVPCLHAVYVNAALNNMLDFDDCYRFVSHPGATIIPPAVSLAEKLGSSGEELVNAVVWGYEVSLRVCDAIRPTPERYDKVRGMAVWQIFGAATVAAKLLKLDADQVAMTLGHAGMNAPVPLARKIGLELEDRPFSWLKNNFGWAAMGGVLAAMLAKQGYRGNKTIFDGPRGFWIMAGSDRCDFDRLTSGLGAEFLMPFTGIKPYASCRNTHATLAAVDELVAAHDIKPEKIASVTIKSLSSLATAFNIRNPSDLYDAQFALPPLVALSLAGFSPAGGIAREHLHDPLVQKLTSLIEMEIDPDADRRFHEERLMPTAVTVRMIDGSTFSTKHDYARGEPECPLSDAELDAKFVRVTGPVIGQDRAAILLSTLRNVDELSDMSPITSLLGKRKADSGRKKQ